MDDFNRTASVVATNIQKLVQNVSSMQRMLVHVDSQGEGLRAQLRQLQHYTGQLAKDTAGQLKQLADAQVLDSGAKLQRERLQDEFTKALNNFQRVQREAAEREKQGLAAAKQNDNSWALAGPGEDQQQQGQSRTQLMIEEEERIGQLEQREQSMRQLESDIVDVNTIFKDLATMVHEQGEIVDSIEQNIESTTVQVTSGTEQLRQAADYQNKARKKKIILAVLGIIILSILVGVIVSQVNN